MSDEHRFAAASFSDFTQIEELHRSQTGAVYSAHYKFDKKRYVLKERKLPELGRSKNIMNEVTLLRQLSHPNVVRCEGFFRDMSRKSLFIVLEFCGGGDLYRVLKSYKKSNRTLPEQLIWHIFYQLCDGLKHLHENGIVHRDIKTMNVMYIAEGDIVKLADLGVSRQVSEETLMLNTFYGTPLYLSPELVENKPYNEKTDIWSLGIILYEMATLTTPFSGNTLLELGRNVISGKYEPLPRQYSVHVGKCVRWMLNSDMTMRPNVVQLLRFVGQRRDEALGSSVPRSKHEPEENAVVEFARRIERLGNSIIDFKGGDARTPTTAPTPVSEKDGDGNDTESDEGGGEVEPGNHHERHLNVQSVAMEVVKERRTVDLSGALLPIQPTPPSSKSQIELPSLQQQKQQQQQQSNGPLPPELHARFGDRLDPAKYKPLPRRGPMDEPSAPTSSSGPAAGRGGWLPDGSSMPAVENCRDGMPDVGVDGAPRSARRRFPTAAGDNVGGKLYETLGGVAPRPPELQHNSKNEDLRQKVSDQNNPKKTDSENQKTESMATQHNQQKTEDQASNLVPVDRLRVANALRQEAAALRKLLQTRDFASQTAEIELADKAKNNRKSASPERHGSKEKRRHRKPSQPPPPACALDLNVREVQRRIQFLQVALDSGFIDVNAPEARRLIQSRDRALLLSSSSVSKSREASSDSEGPDRSLSNNATVEAREYRHHSPIVSRKIAPSSEDSLPLAIAHDRFEPLMLQVQVEQPSRKNQVEPCLPRGRSAAPSRVAMQGSVIQRFPSPPSALHLNLDLLAHPPLAQVIKHDKGLVVPPFQEHEYRGHLEPHQRVRTPRQLGMEGPGPGSPVASPRALRAAKAHVRFRPRSHAAPKEVIRSLSPPRERVVMEPSLYPAAGLLLGGLLRPRQDPYSSKERLPGVKGAEPAGSTTANQSDVVDGVASSTTNTTKNPASFFVDLATNANHARRYHRKAPLSSGDAHRGGVSSAQQRRVPSNEKMKRLFESDDGPSGREGELTRAVGEVAFQV